jgi:hypothetical protein
MVTLTESVQPFGFVPATVYVVVLDGFIVTVEPCGEEVKPVVGVQLYELAPLAVSTTGVPRQVEGLAGDTVTIGKGLTVTIVGGLVLRQPYASVVVTE